MENNAESNSIQDDNTIHSEIQKMKDHGNSQRQDKIEDEWDSQNYDFESSISLNENTCDTSLNDLDSKNKNQPNKYAKLKKR